MPLDKIFKWLRGLFGNRKSFSLGLYGNPSVGKSTLANRVSKDWTGEEMSEVSEVPHTTRSVVKKERIKLRLNGQELTMNLLDMPGIAVKVDYRDFLEYGLSKEDAQKRAREATRGVVDAVRHLDKVDAALFMIDSTEDPYTQVNITIMGNIEARKIPIIIVANKIDLPNANVMRVREAFPGYDFVEVSAMTGENLKGLYREIVERLS